MLTKAAVACYTSLRCKRFGRRGEWHDVSIVGAMHKQNPTAGFGCWGLLTGTNAPNIVVKEAASGRPTRNSRQGGADGHIVPV